MSEVEQERIDAAMERLASAPGFRLACWGCGHEDAISHDPAKRVYRCDRCAATTAYGEPQPRITITPHADRRFVVMNFATKETGIDVVLARECATEYALELLSVTEPAAYRALVRIMTPARPRGPTPGVTPLSAAEPGALELDEPGRNPGSVPPPDTVRNP